MAETATKPKGPTRDELQERLTLETEARSHERSAKSRRDRLRSIDRRLLEWMEANDKTVVRRHGFVITVEEVRARVKWQEEFAEVAGVEAVEAAKERAGTKPRVSVAKA